MSKRIVLSFAVFALLFVFLGCGAYASTSWHADNSSPPSIVKRMIDTKGPEEVMTSVFSSPVLAAIGHEAAGPDVNRELSTMDRLSAGSYLSAKTLRIDLRNQEMRVSRNQGDWEVSPSSDLAVTVPDFSRFFGNYDLNQCLTNTGTGARTPGTPYVYIGDFFPGEGGNALTSDEMAIGA